LELVVPFEFGFPALWNIGNIHLRFRIGSKDHDRRTDRRTDERNLNAQQEVTQMRRLLLGKAFDSFGKELSHLQRYKPTIRFRLSSLLRTFGANDSRRGKEKIPSEKLLTYREL
jgi:hypothetical protein